MAMNNLHIAELAFGLRPTYAAGKGQCGHADGQLQQKISPAYYHEEAPLI
jgi:hypothetical protein